MKNENKTLLLSYICLVTSAAFIFAKDIQLNVVTPFVEGNIRIISPIQAATTKDGLLIERRYNDGGTRVITIIDAHGKSFDIYVDHRLAHEKQWGTIYLNGYPGSRNGIRLSKQTEFKNKIMMQIRPR